MEIIQGQRIPDLLAKILRNRTSIPDRERLAKKLKIHVNTINNKIIEKRVPIKGKKGVKMIRELCKIALRNNDDIAEDVFFYADQLKKLIE